jgi:hypothetical protein
VLSSIPPAAIFHLLAAATTTGSTLTHTYLPASRRLFLPIPVTINRINRRLGLFPLGRNYLPSPAPATAYLGIGLWALPNVVRTCLARSDTIRVYGYLDDLGYLVPDFVSASHEQPPPPTLGTRQYFWVPIYRLLRGSISSLPYPQSLLFRLRKNLVSREDLYVLLLLIHDKRQKKIDGRIASSHRHPPPITAAVISAAVLPALQQFFPLPVCRLASAVGFRSTTEA